MVFIPPQKRALVVDDSSLARRSARRILESLGFTVTEALNGASAIVLFATNNPDVVLLDMVMEGEMNGQATLEKMRGINPTARIFVVTADSDALTKRAVLKAGATGLILKPLSERALRGLLQTTEA